MRLTNSLEVREGRDEIIHFSFNGWNETIYQVIFAYMALNFPQFNIPNWE